MAKKIQLQDANGNVLHPLTLGECVTMSNGENLDTLMSKSQMFTPTIAQDKSMFKVGTGVDVDYSANVKDGAYESLVFKGKSLVNLLTSLRPDTDSAWVRNGSSFTLNASGVLFLNYAALLKPNTTYTVVGELDFDVDGIVIGFREGDKSWEVNRSIGSRGRFAVLISTSAESTSNALTAHRAVTSNSDRVTLSNLMVLEGDWTNAELPPYFEGLGSCKMPILRNVGKNLLNSQSIIYTLSNTSTEIKMKNSLKPNVTYTISFDRNGISWAGRSFYVKGEGFSSYRPTKDFDSKRAGITFSLTDEEVNVLNNDDKSFIQLYSALVTSESLRPTNIQIEESPTQTTYEDHKTNILRTSEEVVLREVNGVQDTYNPLTGEYTKRIGEITLNGSENEWEDWNENSFVLRGSYFSDAFEHSSLAVPRLKCNNMVAGLGETPRTVRYYKSPTVLWTMVGKNDGETLDQFKQWLSQNPATIQYILAEPVTTIVKPSTMTPFAYQNGHAIVESGFEGQSLLPEIEYSVVTGRTGQVTQNTKVLRKQEQQIIGLEELLLTQVVQMEYERTLLQFDYELQMMMLG